jgi:hypothetical protein
MEGTIEQKALDDKLLGETLDMFVRGQNEMVEALVKQTTEEKEEAVEKVAETMLDIFKDWYEDEDKCWDCLVETVEAFKKQTLEELK